MYLNKHRALDKREYLMIIFLISHRNHVVVPHLNCLVETVQMKGSQHMFLCRINKNYPYLSPITPSFLEL